MGKRQMKKNWMAKMEIQRGEERMKDSINREELGKREGWKI